MLENQSVAIACASGGFKAIFVHGVLSAFEEASIKADAYAAASASVFAATWAAIGKARKGGIDYWLEGLRVYQQTNSMSQVSLGGISYFTTNYEKELWSSNQAKLYIATSAVNNPEAAKQTQGQRAKRLGKKLLVSAAKKDRSWVDHNLRLDLFGSDRNDNLILNQNNFLEVAYASTRMLHLYPIPAWISNQPYIDASYTCICPAIEMVKQGYQTVVAIATEVGTLYQDLFQIEIIPDHHRGVSIQKIQPDMNLQELGVDVFQATPAGIAAVYHHGWDKGQEFLNESKDQKRSIDLC